MTKIGFVYGKIRFGALRYGSPCMSMWSLGTRNKWLISQWTRLYDPCDCILARGRVCVGTILEKSGEIKTAKFQV